MRKQWQQVVGAFFCIAILAVCASGAEKEDKNYELMKVFVNTFEQIDRNYVQDVDRRELIEAAIEGMLNKLDQYSSYISPDDLAHFKKAVDQEFGGIGIQIDGPDNVGSSRFKRLTVVSPLPGTPAYLGGVRAGDTIMEIEGSSTEGLTVSDAVKALTGKPGTEVTIGILHEGAEEVEQVKLIRDLIQVATVQGDWYKDDGTWEFLIDTENKIAYMRLTHFSRHSANELREALDGLRERGMRALILDLRYNPGGLLTQATEIADMFIESGRIVSTKGRNTPERTWDAKKDGTYSGFPIAILANRLSASASEIVSACLQDHERAVVIGERTWGKGSVQNVIELEDGSSALKLTTASYHRPSGKNIHRGRDAKEDDDWGVMPNDGFEVKFTREERAEYQRYRVERDVLKKGGPPESDYEDRQVAKAIEYLLGKIDAPSAAEKPKKDRGEKPAADTKSAALPESERRTLKVRLLLGRPA